MLRRGLLGGMIAIAVWASGAGAAPFGSTFTSGFTQDALLGALAAGPGGQLWFTEQMGDASGSAERAGKVRLGRLDVGTGKVVYVAGLAETGTGGAGIGGIALGRDGNMWVTESKTDRIARVTPAGVVTEFVLTKGASPTSIAAGPDGALWLTEPGVNRIARVTTDGVVADFPAGSDPKLDPGSITAGHDGNLWFTESSFGGAAAARIGRITPTGVVTEFTKGLSSSKKNYLGAMVAGPGGNVWFVDTYTDEIGRVTPAGTIALFDAASTGDSIAGLAAGPDGNLWYTTTASRPLDGNTSIGRVSPKGSVSHIGVSRFNSTDGFNPTAAVLDAIVPAGGRLYFTLGGNIDVENLSSELPTGIGSLTPPRAAAFADAVSMKVSAAGAGSLPMVCDAGRGACRGTLILKAGRVVVAVRRYAIAHDSRRAIRLKLNATGRSMVASGRLKVTAVAGGGSARKVTLTRR